MTNSLFIFNVLKLLFDTYNENIVQLLDTLLVYINGNIVAEIINYLKECWPFFFPLYIIL